MITSSGTARRRWPLVAGIALLAIALVALTTAFFTRQNAGAAAPGPTPSPTAPSPSPSGGARGGPTVLADGCLGGSDPSKAILIAHNTAPLTPEGAAAFAATYWRWAGQMPHARDDAGTVGPQVWAPGIPNAMTAIDKVPAEPVTWVDISASKYRVDKITKDTASLSMLTKYISIVNGKNTTKWGIGTVELRAIDGHWRMAGASPLPGSAAEVLRDEGLPFKGGC